MRNVIFVLMLAALIITGCNTYHHTLPPQTGDLPIRMNLAPAAAYNLEVTQVRVTITKGDFSRMMDLMINGSMAEGVFLDLEPGSYAIDVQVFDGITLIATGQGNAMVSPAQTVTVYITMQFVPGGLEIIVGWGLPYENSRRVLMVGNSHTYFNGGVDNHLEAMLAAVHPEWNVVVDAQAPGGYTLENHYNDPASIAAIQNGDWDLVILQEQSSRPQLFPDLFFDYAELLNTVIRQSGAQTGFYMTWAWRNNPEMYVPVRDAYRYIGAYLDAPVVPAGIAFYNADAIPAIPNLYAPDNYHPSIFGSYLVACLMLGKIWNISPVGNPYDPDGIDALSATLIQQLAWDTLQTEYRSGIGVDLFRSGWDIRSKAAA
ncbi:MAG: hypothetical protein U1B83_00505 [Candidatus Cloacimonadaceae bacterium]|nr:hypothetical protein [Candidatus Cloacimonadaceae bacterium]